MAEFFKSKAYSRSLFKGCRSRLASCLIEQRGTKLLSPPRVPPVRYIPSFVAINSRQNMEHLKTLKCDYDVSHPKVGRTVLLGLSPREQGQRLGNRRDFRLRRLGGNLCLRGSNSRPRVFLHFGLNVSAFVGAVVRARDFHRRRWRRGVNLNIPLRQLSLGQRCRPNRVNEHLADFSRHVIPLQVPDVRRGWPCRDVSLRLHIRSGAGVRVRVRRRHIRARYLMRGRRARYLRCRSSRNPNCPRTSVGAATLLIIVVSIPIINVVVRTVMRLYCAFPIRRVLFRIGFTRQLRRCLRVRRRICACRILSGGCGLSLSVLRSPSEDVSVLTHEIREREHLRHGCIGSAAKGVLHQAQSLCARNARRESVVRTAH